jgi:hypothetical protein
MPPTKLTELTIMSANGSECNDEQCMFQRTRHAHGRRGRVTVRARGLERYGVQYTVAGFREEAWVWN